MLCSFRLVLKGKQVNRFTFVENTVSNLPKVPRTKFLRSDGLFCFSSTCKPSSFKNPFAIITSLSELYYVGNCLKREGGGEGGVRGVAWKFGRFRRGAWQERRK